MPQKQAETQKVVRDIFFQLYLIIYFLTYMFLFTLKIKSGENSEAAERNNSGTRRFGSQIIVVITLSSQYYKCELLVNP